MPVERFQGGDRYAWIAYVVERVEFYNKNHSKTNGQFIGPGTGQAAKALVRGAKKGGATVDPRTGAPIKSGVAVGGVINPVRVSLASLNSKQGQENARKEIAAWLKSAARKGIFDHGYVAGSWYSAKDKQVIVEAVEIVHNSMQARKAGRARNQEGVYDIGKGIYHDTGGTGTFKPQASPLIPTKKKGEVSYEPRRKRK